MDKTLATLFGAFGASVGIAGVGFVLFVSKIVVCHATGDWSQFVFEDWPLFMVGGFFAGIFTLILRRAGIKPAPATPEPAPPAEEPPET